MLARPAARLARAAFPPPPAAFISPAPAAAFSSSALRPSPPKPNPSPNLPKKPSSTEPHLTPDELASKKLEETNTPPAPYLTRALGVPTKPTKVPQTKEEWRASLLSKEGRVEERRHLVKQVAKGYFHDYNELRHQGGKAWIAPNTLIREDLSLYFPNIEGTRLSDRAKTHTVDVLPGKVSVVVFSSFKSSEEHINSFVRPTLADLGEDPDFQYVYINLQENPLKSFLVGMFLRSLRKVVPERQQPTYLLSHSNLEYLREPMGMLNKHVGYVFLVDWNGKIRWAGGGWATSEEEESLRRCAHVLVNRRRKGEGK